MDNLISFSRFFADPNIAQHGATVEEFKLQRGNPNPDPILSPMAAPALSEVRLALLPTGSDQLRLVGPAQPEADPYTGPQKTIFLNRNALRKLQGRVLGELQQLVKAGIVADGNLQNLMLDSINRVVGMREFVGHLTAMAESVMVNSLAASKG